MPIDNTLKPRIDSYSKEHFIYGVCCGVLVTIYNFYAYMFSLSLKSSEEQKTNLFVIIYFWSSVITVSIFFFSYLSQSLLLMFVSLIPKDISCCYTLVQIIRCWCKITKEYKKIELQDEEEKRIRDKNYNHLICIAAIQITTYLLSAILFVIGIVTKYEEVSFISSIINSVTHYFFLFYFVYDDDSIKAFKQIIKCKRESTVRQEDLLISNVLVKGEE